MSGDEKKRFCGDCKKNVYNITTMSAHDAANLIRETEGRACIRLYRRKDGTVLTDNCPIGLRKIRDRAKRFAAAVVAGYIWIAQTNAANAQAAGDTFSGPGSSEESRWSQGDIGTYVQGKPVKTLLPKTGDFLPSSGQSCSLTVAPKEGTNGWVLGIAGILSSLCILLLSGLKRRPAEIGLALVAIWIVTGFVFGSNLTKFLGISLTSWH